MEAIFDFIFNGDWTDPEECSERIDELIVYQRNVKEDVTDYYKGLTT